MKRPSLRWAGHFGVLGGVLALGLLGLLQYSATHWDLVSHFRLLSVTEVAWPSSFWLLATNGAEETFEAKVIVAMSVAANAILYASIGGILSAFRRTHAGGDLPLP